GSCPGDRQEGIMNHTLRSLALVFALTVVTGFVRADEAAWNQWRGPNRDGKIKGFQTPAPWPRGLTRKWKVEVGIGHSSPLVVGNAVFSFAREGEDEVTRRLDLATGNPVWKKSYPAPYE